MDNTFQLLSGYPSNSLHICHIKPMEAHYVAYVWFPNYKSVKRKIEPCTILIEAADGFFFTHSKRNEKIKT